MNNFNPFEGKNFPFGDTAFNPFDLIKSSNFKGQNPWLENIKQIPWLEKYINDMFGQNFLQQSSGFLEEGVSIFETLEEVIAKFKLPGIKNVNNLKISLQGLNLIVEAELPDRKKDYKFIKKYKLPAPVTAFGAKAVCKDEIVEVKLPKQLIRQNVDDIEIQFL